MSSSPFLQVYRNLDRQKKLEFLCPKDTLFSYPVVVRREETLFDGLFTYQYEASKRKETALRPSGWLLLSMDTGDISLMAECRAVDFINTAHYPLDSEVSMKLPDTTDASKVKRLSGELIVSYEELRQFVFEENLSRSQVETVVRYKDLFMRLCPKGMYPFYHSLAPSFFHWLRLPLPEQPAVVVQKDEEPTKEYQYQLLILENLQLLVHQFRDKIGADELKEKLFDDLHRQVQEYKNGMLDDLTRHLELDVIQLIDSLAKSLDSLRDKQAGPDKLLALLEGTETDLCDILYRQGIDPYTVPGSDVDVSRQTTVSTVPTANAALDRKVCARLARGWVKAGRIVRPERVTVYVHQPDRVDAP